MVNACSTFITKMAEMWMLLHLRAPDSYFGCVKSEHFIWTTYWMAIVCMFFSSFPNGYYTHKVRQITCFKVDTNQKPELTQLLISSCLFSPLGNWVWSNKMNRSKYWNKFYLWLFICRLMWIWSSLLNSIPSFTSSHFKVIITNFKELKMFPTNRSWTITIFLHVNNFNHVINHKENCTF